MWTVFLNTFGGFAKLAGSHYKEWAPFIFKASCILLLLGFTAGLAAMRIPFFLPLSEVMIDQQGSDFLWLDYAIGTGTRILVIGCGLIAAAFSRQTQAPASFGEFSAKTPRAAWVRFFSFSAVIAITTMIEMYYSFRVNNIYNMEADITELQARRAFLSWVQSAVYIASTFLTPLFAGLTFVKAAGAPHAKFYSKQLGVLMLLGGLMLMMAMTIYYNINVLVFSFLLGGNIIGLIPHFLVFAFIVMAMTGIWIWLICGAFYEEETEFELETAERATIHH